MRFRDEPKGTNRARFSTFPRKQSIVETEALAEKGSMTKIPSQKIAAHMVMVLFESAPKADKNDNHDQDSLKKDLLHTWSWSSENSCSENFKRRRVKDLDVMDLGFWGPGIPFWTTGALWGRVTPFRDHCSKHLSSVLGRTELCHEVRNPRPKNPKSSATKTTIWRFPIFAGNRRNPQKIADWRLSYSCARHD